MSMFEVPEPIINTPFAEPQQHWNIIEGELPELLPGRRPAVYFYRDPKAPPERYVGREAGIAIEMKLVNRIRERVREWRSLGYPGVTRTTLDLLEWWRRDGREQPLFFAQIEAVETVIFLREARADLLQGIEIPRDEPGGEQREQGYSGFLRYACKMATGSGKTTVMGMLAAWSILNKVNDHNDSRFSDVVLIICPNVTIRDRLRELDPEQGAASLYLRRDLVPSHLLPLLAQGRVLITNWHVFEPQTTQVDGVSAKVVRTGVAEPRIETITIGLKTTTARGTRYLTLADFERQRAAGMIQVLSEERDPEGNLKRARIESLRYIKSDRALINDVLGREVGGKQHVLVMNDEAHHAYRIHRDAKAPQELIDFGEEIEAEEFMREATVWVEGLDRIHKLRTINFCVDLSATPYFLGSTGPQANRPFPWIVSDFGLTDAIESGLVKIPQLAVRDTSGQPVPGYFNIWHWILPQLSPAERGGKKASPKPEAILKYAHTPIAMLGGLWEEELRAWQAAGETRPPVFIIVCRNTQIARVIYEWIAEDRPPAGIPPARLEAFRNNGTAYTIRVDSKVVTETDSDRPQADDMRWMRFTLDTVGKQYWPSDLLGRPIYPTGFVELAEKRAEKANTAPALYPPGRDVRCIVSVGMLTEGWDCNTVTHIIGLRPFMSQLLCEQVVGRGLRRISYEPGEHGKLSEEVAKIFGVPFELVPYKSNRGAAPSTQISRRRVHAIPAKAEYAITFPRVEGYTQAIRNRITVDWASVPALVLDPLQIPPEVEIKASIPTNRGRPSLLGPGRIREITLNPYRAQRRMQELIFEMARALTRDLAAQPACAVPAHALFPQLVRVIERYIVEKVEVHHPNNIKDLWLSPWYGFALEGLAHAIRPDTSQGEAPEIPRYENSRGPGSTADVDFFTRRDVYPVTHSHVNYVVADTQRWEQSAAYFIDTHPATAAFVKNAGLGFAIRYMHGGQLHDYQPDFLIRLKGAVAQYVIIETKGYDPLLEVKRAAAERWVAAVNAEGSFGRWQYQLARRPTDIGACLDRAKQVYYSSEKP